MSTGSAAGITGLGSAGGAYVAFGDQLLNVAGDNAAIGAGGHNLGQIGAAGFRHSLRAGRNLHAIGNAAGTPVYTEDVDINAKLIEIINSVIKDDMSDFAKLKALYNYVGSHSTYQEYEISGEDQLSLLKDYFDHSGGTSQHYAAVMAALVEAAGYRCDVISGSFVLNRDTEFEREVRHYWNRMSLNGIVYYLDVEADSNADGTEVRDYYFMAADGNSRWDIYMRDHD